MYEIWSVVFLLVCAIADYKTKRNLCMVLLAKLFFSHSNESGNQ